MFTKILVPVDGSEHSKRALELACDLAGKYDAQLYLLHVTLLPIATLTLALGDTTLSVDALKDEIEEAGQKVIEAARQIALQQGCTKVETSVVNGPAARRILDHAKDNNVDVIVMGNRGLSDIPGLVVGGVKHKVSDHAQCTCILVH